MSSHRKPFTPLALVALTALLLAAPLVTAGTPEDPELTDPAGDVEVEEGILVGDIVEAEDFSDVDILKAWFTEGEEGALSLVVQTAGNFTNTTRMNVSFAVEQGPDSVAGSTADGTRHNLVAEGGGLTEGPDGAEATAVGNLTFFNFTATQVEAAGGDQLTELLIEANRTAGGPTTLEQDDQSGLDVAPNEGNTSASFTISREAPFAALTLEALDGRITADEGDGEATRDFEGTSVETKDGDAAVVFNLRVTNDGSDPDTVELSVEGPASATVGLDESSLTLDPEESADAVLTVQLAGQDPGTYDFVVEATSDGGASEDLTFTLTVNEADGTPPPAATTPAGTPPPGDDGGGTEEQAPVLDVPVLTGISEALGLDALHPWGEVVVLLLLLLLLALVVFLILFLATRQWISLRVTPGQAVAAPGETAEYQVELHNRKKRAYQARLHFETDDPAWKTGILVTQEDGATLDPLTSMEQELEFTLNGRGDPGDQYTGTLRVRVPETAADQEQIKVALGVVPVDEEGEERRNKARFAQVRVRSDVAAATPPEVVEPHVRLSKVEHDPVDPEPGEKVTTAATLENDDTDQTWVLRVVLNVDGEDLQEQVLAVPPRKARAVIFSWTARDDENRVRVQVYQKES